MLPARSGPTSDPKPLSVAELDRVLRNAVESVSSGVWVQGEVTSLKRAASGHVYLTLKDEREDAVVEAVAYRDSAQRARVLLTEGARVLVRGKATVWSPRGRLQFIVEAVRPAGRGALLEALEKLKQQLAAEGLFAAERKKKVPTNARVVGVVTSSSGAVIHDIIRVAFRRGAVKIILSPAQVQGDGAAESMVGALDRLEAVPHLDVIIVGRGGGSSEDLGAFNDERLVRRIAACRVPVISAVGHEVDISLTDLVADGRASTPSQAAEMVVADQRAQRDALEHLRSRLHRSLRHELLSCRAFIDRLTHRLGDPRASIAEHRQKLDDLELRLQTRLRGTLRQRRNVIERIERRLLSRHPRVVLVGARGRVERLQARLGAAARAHVTRRRGQLIDNAGRLESLSPLAVLARGYAIATGPDGRALRDACETRIGQEVGIRLRKGSLVTKVDRVVNFEDLSNAVGEDD